MSECLQFEALQRASCVDLMLYFWLQVCLPFAMYREVCCHESSEKSTSSK
jgi:hypothetical protein